MSDVIAITAACTCTVDGVSGTADTRYNGYSFTGCGAHVDYHNLSQGAGYNIVWCYATSPDDCPGRDPWVPEGFQHDNTLDEWKARGAAWKKCYDGYRCEAWWGTLEGTPVGSPVVIAAPLDWPDCCALCSESTGVHGNGTAECVAWTFDPSTGSCQLMSAVQSLFVADGWGVNETVHGYPGYFEAPVRDCWNRGRYDLCLNASLAFLIAGIILASLGVYCFCFGVLNWEHDWSDTKERFQHPDAYLEKAACMQVKASSLRIYGSEGAGDYRTTYTGTFLTRCGSIIRSPNNEQLAPRQFRKLEQRMLKLLFQTALDPMGTRRNIDGVTSCQTSEGRRRFFASLESSCGGKELARGETRVIGNATASGSARFDCLLFVCRRRALVASRSSVRRGVAFPEVVLVGILGEDRITCFKMVDNSRMSAFVLCLFLLGAALLVLMCVVLLTNDAAQVMASWTYPGTNYRVGAIVGLVLIACIPFSLFMWVRHRTKRAIQFMDTMRSSDAGRQLPPRA